MNDHRPPLLPDHWTPAQALAVFEIIESLRDELWALYHLDIQRALRRDRVTRSTRRPDPNTPDTDPPF